MRRTRVEEQLAKYGIPPRGDLPREFRHANSALIWLDDPIDRVPVGTLVQIKIEIPDNRSGKYFTLAWLGKDAMSVEDARAQICKRLIAAFLDAVMPLPE